MHKSFWARLLSCVLALSVVLAAVPKPAQAVYYVVGDGGSYALMEYFRHRWPDGGYKLWTDYPQEFRAIISNGGNAFTNYSQRWVGMDYLIGKYGVTEPEDMGTNSAEVLSQLNAARQAFDDAWAQYQETNKPYQPGGIGGGSGSSGGGDEPSQPSTDDVYQPYYSCPSSGTLYGVPYYFADDVSVPFTLLPSSVAAVDGIVLDGKKMWLGWESGSSGQEGNLNMWVVPAGVMLEFTSDKRLVLHNTNDYEVSFYNCLQGGVSLQNGVVVNTTKLDCMRKSISAGGTYGVGNISYMSNNGEAGSGGGTGGTVGPVPDPSTIEKPESPASPTNPQTPERDTQTIIVTGTTQQVPEPAPAPDLSTLEQLLRLILANTNTIIEQMNSFSSQLGQMLASEYDMVFDWFKTTNDWLDQLQAQMTRQLAWDDTFFDWLKNIDSDIQYLQSVAQNGFNDVTTWLQNIFNRMLQGNGGGSKPGVVDPTDPSPLTDWLTQLWTSFLADLQMVLPNQVGAVVDFLDQLRTKFPFSIPWDIGLMLGLLSHAPVTPVFQLPWGYGRQAQEPVTVDLHAWDSTMEMVRPMFLLLFALGLALLTRQLLAGLEGLV